MSQSRVSLESARFFQALMSSRSDTRRASKTGCDLRDGTAAGRRHATARAIGSSCLAADESFWETEDDLRAAEELGREARRRVMDAGGGQGEPVVERWEVVFDEMV
jgi:hypothetical protein